MCVCFNVCRLHACGFFSLHCPSYYILHTTPRHLIQLLLFAKHHHELSITTDVDVLPSQHTHTHAYAKGMNSSVHSSTPSIGALDTARTVQDAALRSRLWLVQTSQLYANASTATDMRVLPCSGAASMLPNPASRFRRALCEAWVGYLSSVPAAHALVRSNFTGLDRDISRAFERHYPHHAEGTSAEDKQLHGVSAETVLSTHRAQESSTSPNGGVRSAQVRSIAHSMRFMEDRADHLRRTLSLTQLYDVFAGLRRDMRAGKHAVLVEKSFFSMLTADACHLGPNEVRVGLQCYSESIAGAVRYGSQLRLSTKTSVGGIFWKILVSRVRGAFRRRRKLLKSALDDAERAHWTLEEVLRTAAEDQHLRYLLRPPEVTSFKTFSDYALALSDEDLLVGSVCASVNVCVRVRVCGCM
jgi:hypothetical protein